MGYVSIPAAKVLEEASLKSEFGDAMWYPLEAELRKLKVTGTKVPYSIDLFVFVFSMSSCRATKYIQTPRVTARSSLTCDGRGKDCSSSSVV